MIDYEDYFGELTKEEYEIQTAQHFSDLADNAKIDYKKALLLINMHREKLFDPQVISQEDAEILYLTIRNWEMHSSEILDQDNPKVYKMKYTIEGTNNGCRETIQLEKGHIYSREHRMTHFGNQCEDKEFSEQMEADGIGEVVCGKVYDIFDSFIACEFMTIDLGESGY